MNYRDNWPQSPCLFHNSILNPTLRFTLSLQGAVPHLQACPAAAGTFIVRPAPGPEPTVLVVVVQGIQNPTDGTPALTVLGPEGNVS